MFQLFDESTVSAAMGMSHARKIVWNQNDRGKEYSPSQCLRMNPCVVSLSVILYIGVPQVGCGTLSKPMHDHRGPLYCSSTDPEGLGIQSPPQLGQLLLSTFQQRLRLAVRAVVVIDQGGELRSLLPQSDELGQLSLNSLT
jgi:hypothetical protein